MFVILILNLCIIVTAESKCSIMEKVQCTAAAAGCSTKCISDFPESAKYEDCVICVSFITSNCCKCVFPNWTGCNYAKSLNILPKIAEDIKIESTRSNWRTFVITLTGILMVFFVFIMTPIEPVNSRLLKLLCVFIIWWLLLSYFV